MCSIAAPRSSRTGVPIATGTLGQGLLPQRPCVGGKFLYTGDEKLWVRGVTYGTFRPADDGGEYHTPEMVERDFAQIRANGMNAIRTYTVPPRWVLDAAQQHGLRVLLGLPWEQHVTFLDEKGRARDIVRRVAAGVRSCAGHPAILCYAIGNEIPAPIVRWHGYRRVERFLEQLYQAAKAEDPDGLTTYVNYPSTEYLELPFVDVVCFNVFLESQRRYAAYLARLQNLAGDRPLIMAEIGLDSRRHGEDAQAGALDWQVRTAFAAGCAGAFVFAWTDEWHRGGHDIGDWDFGLTDRDRRPKPALETVRRAFAQAPLPAHLSWPRISVVVCSCNGARSIRDCFEGLRKLEYPDFEVIVVDDGSTDETAAITQEYGFWLIRTGNRGLSNARNTGLEAATGEIVAYIDDDAHPDPHWLKYLAAAFMREQHAGVGGPNIACPDDGPIGECVAHAPGGPVHVLLTDDTAEHIPGCNMAFRKSCLQAIGGFDPQFRVAGDDVDVCWRLRRRGWTLGFSAGAMVWHHRRTSVGAYWKQQKGYGKAEALLERKWPEKYNPAGHLTWAGRVYHNGSKPSLGWSRRRIYEGTWGLALFKSVYQPGPSLLEALGMMPEWYLVIGLLAALSALGVLWRPFIFTIPLLALAVGTTLIPACARVGRARFPRARHSRISRLKLRTVTVFLHLLQPLARLSGRLRLGLTPWRRRGIRGWAWPRPRTLTLWRERWQSSPDRLVSLEGALLAERAVVRRGGDYETWDLEVQDGTLGAVRMRMVIEEHGAGNQLLRLRTWATCSRPGLALVLLFNLLCIWTAIDRAWVVSAVFGGLMLMLSVYILRQCGVANAAFLRSFERWRSHDEVVAPAPEWRNLVDGSRRRFGSSAGVKASGSSFRSRFGRVQTKGPPTTEEPP